MFVQNKSLKLKMFKYMRIFEEDIHRSIHYFRHWLCVLYKPFVEELVSSYFKDMFTSSV